MKYILELKHNATNQTKMVTINNIGENYIDNINTNNLDALSRLSILNEIKQNYLDEQIDWEQYTIHMVSDKDMSQVI